MASCVVRNCSNPDCKQQHRVFVEGQVTRFSNYEYVCPHCETVNRFRNANATRFDDVFPKGAIIAAEMG